MANGAGGGKRKAGLSQKVLQQPENRLCADCCAKDPRWSSVNLGILICEVCAGIHRRLGTHISKVKSVTLDEWKDEWVEMVESVGNARARAFYEHDVPKEERYISGAARIQGADRVNKAGALLLERWIRAKYEEKRFVPPGVPAPAACSRPSQWPAFEKQWPGTDGNAAEALPAPAAFAAFPCSPAANGPPASAGPWPNGFTASGAAAGVPADWQREGPAHSTWPATDGAPVSAEAWPSGEAGPWPEGPAGAWPSPGSGVAAWPADAGSSGSLSFDGASAVRLQAQEQAQQKQPQRAMALGKTVGCFPCRFAARRSSIQKRKQSYGRGSQRNAKDTGEDESFL